jgi:hypothetical protein
MLALRASHYRQRKQEMNERYSFKLTTFDEVGSGLPPNHSIEVQFDGDCHITTVLEAFKYFLKGCSFGEVLVDRIVYEED